MDLSAYRPNVGIVVFRPDGRVWFGRRARSDGPYAWQFPQGGIDDGEDLEAAARRELAEETGIRSVTVLDRTADWIAYEFPADTDRGRKGWRGQKQIWFAVRFDGRDEEIDLEAHPHVEFDAWRWGRLEDAADLIVPFKRAAYAQVIAAFSRFVAGC